MSGITGWAVDALLSRVRDSRAMSVAGSRRDFWDSGVYVSKDEMGDAWPLTVDGVTLYCLAGWVLVEDDEGTYYWVNGGPDVARTWFGVETKNIRRIWRDDPRTPDLKVNIGPIIDRGHEICAEQGR